MRAKGPRPRCLIARFSAFLTALLALAVLPAEASAGKHKAPEALYAVSLAGSVRLESSETREGLDEGAPPLGCIGSGSETRRLSASARLATKPRPISVAYYGRNFPFLSFRSALSSLSASATLEAAGSFATDPTEPYPPSASECAFTPKRTEAKCAFQNQAELEGGAYFQISPELAINPVAPLQRKNRFFIYSNETVQVQCDPGAIDGYMLAEAAGVETKLRVGSVLALRKGRRLTDSGTAVFPVTGADGKPDGTQTIAYSISVKRVR